MFGLRIRSNVPLPGLEAPTSDFEIADVTLHVGIRPSIEQPKSARGENLVYTSPYVTESGEPALRVWKMEGGALQRMDYYDGTHFWLTEGGDEVWADWPEELTLEDTATYLLGPVFGYLLRLRGVTCLHASAVDFGGRAVAFVGPAGAGKSTLAAALALRGYTVLSDDIVAVVERDAAFRAMPAYPYLSLWQDSVQALYGDDSRLAPFSANFSKRMLPLTTMPSGDLRFARDPVLLDSIFLLGERSGDASAPFVEEVEKREALISLVGNTYASNLLDSDLRAREFEFLGRLIGTVRVRRLHSHQESSRIGTLCDLVERELAQKRCPNSITAALP